MKKVSVKDYSDPVARRFIYTLEQAGWQCGWSDVLGEYAQIDGKIILFDTRFQTNGLVKNGIPITAEELNEWYGNKPL